MGQQYQPNSRKNYHIDTQTLLPLKPPTPKVAIFGPQPFSDQLRTLADHLRRKNLPVEFKTRPEELSQLFAARYTKGQRILVLIETSKENANTQQSIFPQDYKFPYPEENLKLYFYPFRLRADGFDFFASPQEVLEFCSKYFSAGESRHIKLTSVHSIKGSKDKRAIESAKSLKTITTGHQYSQLYFQKDVYNEYDTKAHSLNYDSLTEALEAVDRTVPFRLFKEIDKKQSKNQRKYLLLTSTNEKSLKILDSLRKIGSDSFDVVLLGEMKPTNDFLDERIVLVTSDVQKIINFFVENGFDSLSLRNYQKRLSMEKNSVHSSSFRNTMANIIRDSSDSSNQNIVLRGGIVQETNQPKPAHHWIVEKEDPKTDRFVTQEIFDSEVKIQEAEKKKVIKKIKNGKTKSKEDVMGSIQVSKNMESVKDMKQSEPSIKKGMDSKKSNQVVVSQDSYQYSSPKAEQSSRSTHQRTYENDRYQNSNSSSNGYSSPSAKSPQPQYTKPPLGLQYRYRNYPSNIIHEVSEEYRGSNKESIMNLEPDMSFKTIRNPQPSQFNLLSENQGSVDENSGNKKINGNYPNGTSPQNSNNKSTERILEENKIVPVTITNPPVTYYNNYSSNTPKIIPSPITYTSTSSTGGVYQIERNGTRTYGRVNGQSYQSPSKVVRKVELSAPEEITSQSSKPQITSTNRIQANVQSSRTAYSPASQNYQTVSPSITTVKTIQPIIPKNILPPQQEKKQSMFGNVKQISKPPTTFQRSAYSSPIDELRNLNTMRVNLNNNGNASQAKNNDTRVTTTRTVINNTGINLDQYDRIERDGMVVYKKKVLTEAISPQNRIKSPEAVSPRTVGQNAIATRKYETPTNRVMQVNYQSGSDSNAIKKNIAEVAKPTVSQFTKKEYTSQSESPIYQTYNISSKVNEDLTPIKIEEMLQSSHKRKVEDISGQEKKGTDYYKTKVSTLPRVEVERADKFQPKVDARNLHTKPTNNIMNDSNMFSRMSELHSDGSILRRNNIRFGVKPKKKEEKTPDPNISIMMESRLVSGIYKANELNKKMTLNRIISGEDYLSQERDKYIHINTKFNNFHFIIQEEMDYLNELIANYIATSNDKIQNFGGTEQLFECLRPDKLQDKYDVGFIFARKHQLNIININLFPEDYYVVLIEQQDDGILEINETQKKVRIDHLRHIVLAQKIIVDSKLYQYVAYRNHKKEIQLLADKFMNTEFILQKIETEFTSMIIDFYYCQLPRLTRLYLLCDEKQLPQLLKLLKIYEEFNPSFNRQSCKLLCLITNILNNDELIMNHTNVTFISNPEQMRNYQDILRYAHHSEEERTTYLPIDQIFYHTKHTDLPLALDRQFPGRFVAIEFSKMQECYSRIDKMAKINEKHQCKQRNYLVLHETLSGEKINTAKFTKVFMLGRAKVVQSQVMKVLNTAELLELLR